MDPTTPRTSHVQKIPILLCGPSRDAPRGVYTKMPFLFVIRICSVAQSIIELTRQQSHATRSRWRLRSSCRPAVLPSCRPAARRTWMDGQDGRLNNAGLLSSRRLLPSLLPRPPADYQCCGTRRRIPDSINRLSALLRLGDTSSCCEDTQLMTRRRALD